jgi:predicted esterase
VESCRESDEVAGDAIKFGARVNVIGFSQGTATASRWATHGRATLHRLILWSGLIPPDTDLTHGHSALRHTALTLVLGTSDHYVDEKMFAAERARLDAARIAYDVIRFEGGHVIDRSVFSQLQAMP